MTEVYGDYNKELFVCYSSAVIIDFVSDVVNRDRQWRAVEKRGLMHRIVCFHCRINEERYSGIVAYE